MLLAGVRAPAQTPAPTAQERMLDEIRVAVTPTARGGAREDLLASLRILRDPSLRPLFAALAESQNPALRANGVLGAAEIDPDKGLDMFLLSRIKDPAEQAQLLAQALRLNLAGVSQAHEALAWKDLTPELELVALARLVKAGEAVPQDRLRELAQNDRTPVAVMASLLLLHAAGGDATGPAFDRLFDLPENARRPILGLLLQFVRRESPEGAAPFVERVLAAAGADRTLAIESVETLLALAPKRGAADWLRMYGSADGLSTKLLLGMSALVQCDTAPGEVFDAMVHDPSSPLLRAMGEAGRAVASGEGAEAALVALARLGHATSCAWIVDRALKMPDGPAVAVCEAVVRAAADGGAARPDLRIVALPAASVLAERDPAAFNAAIKRACDAGDDGMCQSLLAGALRSSAKADPLGPAPHRWPGRQCAALATMVRARFADPLTPEQLTALEEVATGNALPSVFRVQASWLALRRSGQDRVALARLLAQQEQAGSSGPPGR